MDCTMEKSKIQMLYDACNSVFSQKELPTFKQIQLPKNILNIFEAVDVGVDEFSLDVSPGASPKITNGLISGPGVSEITYIHIYECDNFSMGIFCLPAGKTFPLHDHPGMTVLSKLLYGSAYVKAYDWVPEGNSSPRTNGLARTVIDGNFNAPCEPSVLFPRSGGNIHSFTALTPCAILDVLSPPYSDNLGRPSTYFSDFPIPSLPGYALLQERQLKLQYDLVVNGAPYLGPPLDVAGDLWQLQLEEFPKKLMEVPVKINLNNIKTWLTIASVKADALLKFVLEPLTALPSTSELLLNSIQNLQTIFSPKRRVVLLKNAAKGNQES